MKPFLRPGMTALDVGCGKGHYSIGMAKLVGAEGRVVSVDTKAESITALRQRVERSRLRDRIDSRRCSEEDLAVEDLAGRIDFAVAVYVVHHAAAAGRLMKNVHDALKAGGAFLVIEPRHHASPDEREAVVAAAKAADFKVSGQPKLYRDWAVLFAKDAPVD